jgi:DtxR family transcriptional regulator, Mn-dependent transcriptional regulator
MASETVEDYLRALFLKQQSIQGKAFVPMNALAGALDVTAGTASVMVQGLAKGGYVDYRKRVGSRLTPRGEAEALQVLRRHRIVELFLVRILGLDWSEVHEEAHRLEHALSELVLTRMEELLGHPTVDPHGDPIPDASGGIDDRTYASLAEAPLASRLRVVRVVDQEPGFLRFLESKHIGPGSVLVIEEGGELSGALSLRSDAFPPVSLGWAEARNILVEPEAG